MEDQELCLAVASLLARALKRGFDVTVQLWSCPRHCVRSRVCLAPGGDARAMTRSDGSVAVLAECVPGLVVFEVKDGRTVAKAPAALWYEVDACVASQELFVESGTVLLHCTRHVNSLHQWPADECAKCQRQRVRMTEAEDAAVRQAEADKQCEWEAIDRMLRYVKRKREFEERAEEVHDEAVRWALVKLLCGAAAEEGSCEIWPHMLQDAKLRWDPVHALYVFQGAADSTPWVRVHCRERGLVYKCGGGPGGAPDLSWRTLRYEAGVDMFMELLTEYYDTHAPPAEEDGG